MTEDPLAIAPEIGLLAGAVIALLAGSYLPRTRQWITRLVAGTALLVAALFAASALADPSRTVFGAFTLDRTTGVVRLIVIAATLLVICLGIDELSGTVRESETYVLLLLSALGADVMAATSDLVVLAVAFLLASIPLYGLIGLSRTRQAAEATLKAYLLGALFNILLLLGAAILFAVAGGTAYQQLAAGLSTAPTAAVAIGLLGVLGGLLFKAGGVPAHFWVPDATQVAGTTAAAFLTTVPKIGALVALYRLVAVIPDSVNWPLLVAVLAAATMTLGNLAAFAQTDARRLLGWSTVSQVGYLLLPIAAFGHTSSALPALLVYLGGYAVTNLTAFAVVAAVPDRHSLTDYRGLSRQHPWLAAALLVSLLSLVGTPPTAVFIGKLSVFTAAWDGGAAWLVVVAAINTVASLFYYLRWIAPSFGESERGEPGSPLEPMRWAYAAAVTAATCTLALGLAAAGAFALASG
ncbi:MAG: NADH-quinone oxidoreductase subunit N [Motilibacteraceae bacterium]